MKFRAPRRFNSAFILSTRKAQKLCPRRFSRLCCLLLFVALGHHASARTLEARLSVVSLSPAPRLKVEGDLMSGTSVWSFRNSYASVIGLGERIENLKLADASGATISVRKLASGEYESVADATHFSYEVKLDAPEFPSDSAYVSWLTSEFGFLMPGDLLPRALNDQSRSPNSLTVKLDLPAGWQSFASGIKRAENQFEIKDAERAVFFVGRALRERRERAGPMTLNFITVGDWAFSDEDAANTASSFLKEHAEMIGGATADASATLMLAPFPRPVSAERWSAETRGTTLVLLSGKSASKTAGLSQLSVPLAHELFHLWLPNGMALDGEYDWFYEGFTNYQALRAGVRLNFLTFQDYLNALARAFDAYKSVTDRDKLSLVDASKHRWAGATAIIYHKGLLTAFLYDLSLRRATGGKRSLDDVYRELFKQFRLPNQRQDGNTAVIAVLKKMSGMDDFTRRYVEAASAIDLESEVAPFGLIVEHEGARTRLAVAGTLKREQRDLLRKVGYNDETRRTATRLR